jgi:hypothetical protein
MVQPGNGNAKDTEKDFPHGFTVPPARADLSGYIAMMTARLGALE